MITYFVLSHSYFEGYLKKEKNFQTFKEKLQKKVTKKGHVIIPIQPDFPGLQFMKKELFTKMAIVAKVVVSDFSFLFGCVL